MAFLDFVPGFVKPEALDKINSDYPTIVKPGNFPLDGLDFGPVFQQFVDEMQGPDAVSFPKSSEWIWSPIRRK